MTNYIIEGNIDFYKLLNDFPNEKETEKDEKKEICLISNKPLSEYYITLPCNHKFNYLPLLNSLYENFQLKRSYITKQLKCPYCKTIHKNNVIPYNSLLDKRRIVNLNYPPKLSIGNNNCDYIYKNGKNKGCKCSNKSYWKYCHLHLKYLNKTNVKDCKTNVKDFNFEHLKNINLKTIGTDDLKKMTVLNLRKLAKINNKKNYSKLKKAELINFIKSE